MITLYVKTHRVTGLKYFGKTTLTNPISYRGSGTYWKRHIAKYGYDCDTEIVGMFEDINEASAIALKFSQDHNIVKSPEWANLIPENAFDGGALKGIPNPHHSEIMKGRKASEETRRKMSEAAKGKPKSKEHIQKVADALRGRKLSKESIEKMRKALTGRKHTEEARKHMKESKIGIKQPNMTGEKNPFAKLTETKVIEILTKYKSWDRTCSQRALAKEYGVSRSIVKNILENKTWTYINRNNF